MDVLINDKTNPVCTRRLREGGYETTENHYTEKELVREIPKYHGLIVRSGTTVDRDVIEAGYDGNLRIISRAGTGVDNIDLKAAKERGIEVKNVPGGNTVSVAELTTGLMVCLYRGIPWAYEKLKNNEWAKKEYMGRQLKGKTLGIVGCGRIGTEVARKASNGYYMIPIGFDPFITDNEVIELANSMEEVLTRADFVTLHVPRQKKPLIGEEELRVMGKDSYLLNAARGGVVDEEALYKALRNGEIAGAYCDVFEEEGAGFSSPLIELPNFIGTPHLGASTVEGQEAIAKQVAEDMVAFLEEGSYHNSVVAGERIRDDITEPSYTVQVFHDDVPGMFGAITGTLGDAQINLRDIDSRKMGSRVLTTVIAEGDPEEAETVKPQILDNEHIYRVCVNA